MNYTGSAQGFYAEKGVIDLTGWDESLGKNAELNGEWKFYPNRFMYPGDFGKENTGSGLDSYKYVKVPGNWNRYLNGKGSAEGAGTFSLLIKVPKDGIYGLKTKTIRTASRTYVNGIEVCHTGNPALTEDDFVTESRYKTAFFESINGEIHLTLHIASYGHRSGGIISPIEFGTYNSIMKRNSREIALDTMIISIGSVE